MGTLLWPHPSQTDDPGVFNLSIENEYALLFESAAKILTGGGTKALIIGEKDFGLAAKINIHFGNGVAGTFNFGAWHFWSKSFAFI